MTLESSVTTRNRRHRDDVPAGWRPIFDRLLLAMARLRPEPEIVQAKEKLGALRVYIAKGDARAAALVEIAAREASRHCQICGTNGMLRVNDSRTLRLLCDRHASGPERWRIVGEPAPQKAPRSPSYDRQETEARLPWPLIALDFEASALGQRSYPIEVGIARWDAPEEPIRLWSTLIRPTQTWIDHGVWNPTAQQIHGIQQEALSEGLSPLAALSRLIALTGHGRLWCDGGESDRNWLATLAIAAGIPATCTLADWDMLGGALHPRRYRRMIRWLDKAPARHRAADDAERLLRAIAVALGRRYGASIRIA